MGLNEVVDALERAEQLLEDGETGLAQDSLSWQQADDDAGIQLGKACAMLGTCRQLRQGTNNYSGSEMKAHGFSRGMKSTPKRPSIEGQAARNPTI